MSANCISGIKKSLVTLSLVIMKGLEVIWWVLYREEQHIECIKTFHRVSWNRSKKFDMMNRQSSGSKRVLNSFAIWQVITIKPVPLKNRLKLNKVAALKEL
jgi:hypothetical protein